LCWSVILKQVIRYLGQEVDIKDTLEYRHKEHYKYKQIGHVLFILIVTMVPTIAPYFWPKNIDEEYEKLFYISFAFINHEFFWVFANLCMYFFVYSSKSTYWRQFKVHDQPWPWEENKEQWKKDLKKSIGVIAFNQFVIVPLFILLSYKTNKGPVNRVSYETLPSPFEVLWQLYFFVVVEDCLFYWGHRLLHWGPFYKYVHKTHHDYKNVVSIATEHTHWVEFFIGNILPANAGFVFLGLRAHLLTQSIWINLRITKATDAHSGYNIPFLPNIPVPKKIPSQFHNFHHLSFNNNYGSFMRFWDDLCGTVAPKYKEFLKENNYK